MKKTLIMFVAVSLGLATAVNAQDSKADKIKFGIKAGGNLMTLGTFKSGNDEFDYNYKPGITVGIFSEIPLGGNFKFIPEVNYSQKGADVEGEIAGNTGKLEQRVNYLDVPISFSYQVAPKFSLFAGPQVSFLLNQKTETFVNGDKISESTDTKDVAKTVAGALLGIGYEFTPNLNVTGRYMRDLQKGSEDDDPAFEDIRNSGFALTLGYKF